MSRSQDGFARRALVELIQLQNHLPRSLRDSLTILRRRPHWERAGIIYVHIPRTGGTSITNAIYGRPLGHLRAVDIRSLVPRTFASTPVFSIARNPWDRLVSAYHFTVQGGTDVAGVRNPNTYRSAPFRSFAAFVEEWLVDQTLSTLDEVFHPQSIYVTDQTGGLIVDYCGRFGDFGALARYLSETLSRDIVIPTHNASRRKRDFHSYYETPALANIVGDLYSTDVTLFGFDY